jgi:hypothetical protein
VKDLLESIESHTKSRQGQKAGGGGNVSKSEVACRCTAEHLLTLVNAGAIIEDLLLYIASIQAELFVGLSQQASEGKREYLETPDNASFDALCKVYNTLLALQENIVRPRSLTGRLWASVLLLRSAALLLRRRSWCQSPLAFGCRLT